MFWWNLEIFSTAFFLISDILEFEVSGSQISFYLLDFLKKTPKRSWLSIFLTFSYKIWKICSMPTLWGPWHSVMFCFWLNMSLKSKQHFLSKWKLTLKSLKYPTFFGNTASICAFSMPLWPQETWFCFQTSKKYHI